MAFFRKNLIDITIFILLQYFFISFTLMYLYSGGNPIHHNATGYVWNLNYLSDLGREYFFNGDLNPFWIFYSLSLAIVATGTFLYFYIVSSLVNNNIAKKTIVLLGFLSAMGYLFLGVFQVDVYLSRHLSAGMLAFYSFYLAEFLLIIFINRKTYPMVYYLTLLLILLFLVRISLIYFTKNSELDNQTLLNIKTISQKIIVYGQIIISTCILISLKKRALYTGQ